MAWKNDPHIKAVAVRGVSKKGPFGTLCAGGDIRFFYQAALATDSERDHFLPKNTHSTIERPGLVHDFAHVDHFFSMGSVSEIVGALKAENDDWAHHTAQTLRMERNMVQRCFYPLHLRRSAIQSETLTW